MAVQQNSLNIILQLWLRSCESVTVVVVTFLIFLDKFLLIYFFEILTIIVLPSQRRLRSFLGVTLKGDLVPAHPPQVVFGGIVSAVLFSVCFLGVERFDSCEEAVLGWLCMCSG